MTVDTHIYDGKFFQNTIEFEAASANAAASIIYAAFSPKSVVDVGCGAGLYLAEFKKMGVSILGIEGSAHALPYSLVPDETIIFDLTENFQAKEKFDLCLCIEVAEHLPQEKADVLVSSLTSLSDTIIFTAAVPGQGPVSIGHINEQLPAYWHKKFFDRGFVYHPETTKDLRQKMIDQKVVWWITNNLMIFNKHEK